MKIFNFALTVLVIITAFQPAFAVQDFNDDVRINQGTPALIFNDSDDPGLDFYILGRQASFNIKDHATEVDVFSYWKSGQRATFGYGAAATADRALAIGRNSLAEATTTIAIGDSAEASGPYGISLGNLGKASGGNSIAIGVASFAEVLNATAIGTSARASAEFSTALGHQAHADSPWTIILGSKPDLNNQDEYHDVGIGTTQPLAPLHVLREDSTQRFLYLQSQEPGAAQDRAMMFLQNNGGIRFEFRDQNQHAGWRFQAQTGGNDRFEVTKVATGEIEASFRPNGNLFISGNLFTNSDVNAKQDIVPVNGKQVLDRVAALPISEWSYKDATQHRHIGPMAQDFHAAFGLGDGDTTLTATDMAGVSLAATQALNRKLEASNLRLEQSNLALAEENQSLVSRLSELERQVQALMSGR